MSKKPAAPSDAVHVEIKRVPFDPAKRARVAATLLRILETPIPPPTEKP